MFLSWTYYCVSCLLTSFRHGTIYNWYSLFHWDPFGPQQGGCFVQCSIACGVAIPCTLFTRRIFSYHVHPIRCLRADGAERVRWNVSSVHDQKYQRSLYKLYIYIYIYIYIHIYIHIYIYTETIDFRLDSQLSCSFQVLPRHPRMEMHAWTHCRPWNRQHPGQIG